MLPFDYSKHYISKCTHTTHSLTHPSLDRINASANARQIDYSCKLHFRRKHRKQISQVNHKSHPHKYKYTSQCLPSRDITHSFVTQFWNIYSLSNESAVSHWCTNYIYIYIYIYIVNVHCRCLATILQVKWRINIGYILGQLVVRNYNYH